MTPYFRPRIWIGRTVSPAAIIGSRDRATASAVRLPPPALCYADELARRPAGRWRKRRNPGLGYSAFWLALAMLGLVECWALVMVTP